MLSKAISTVANSRTLANYFLTIPDPGHLCILHAKTFPHNPRFYCLQRDESVCAILV